MKDDDLKSHVAAEFSWDPQVDSDAIEVSAASGTVTLRGIVASLRLKRAGGEAAARVRGVTRSPMSCGCRSRTQTCETMRTCAGTCWKR
jgi:hypothetical protein